MKGDMKNISKFMVGSIPTVYYLPDFITDQEELQLLHNISHAPIAKWKSLKNRRLQNWGGVVHEKGLLPQDLPPWLTKITHSISKASGFFPSAINHVLINEYLPDQGIMPHQDGPAYFPVVAILSLGSPIVMDFTPHSSMEFSRDLPRMNDQSSNAPSPSGSFSDTVVTGKCLDDHPSFSVLLMPRSLLIFKDQVYSDYLHGIKDCVVHNCNGAVNLAEDLNHLVEPEEENRTADISKIHRSTKRISLTCREVSKVYKNLFKLQ